MMPETLERLLFNQPAWPDSLRCTQSQLGFSPDFAAAELQYWESRHGYREVLEIALTQVEKQKLPPYFALYWTICFYTNWERGLDKIVWPASWPMEAQIEIASRIASAIGLSCTDDTPKVTVIWGFPLGEKGKVYPPYPFALSIPPLFTFIDGYTKKPISSKTEILSVHNIWEINSRFYCRLCDAKDGLQPRFIVEIPDEFGNEELLKLAYWLSFRLKLYTRSLTVWTQAGDKDITTDYRIRVWGYVHKVSNRVSLRSLPDLRKVVIEHGPRRLSNHIHRGKVPLTYKSPKIRRSLKRYAAGQATFEDLLSEEWFSKEVQSDFVLELEGCNDISRQRATEQQRRKLVYRRVRRRLERAGFKPPPPKWGWWLKKGNMT